MAISILEKFKLFRESFSLREGPKYLGNNIFNQKDILARVYLQNGELNNTIAEYERLITFDPNGKSKYLVNPRNYYRVAKSYKKKGQKAIKHYKKFLYVWRYADLWIPEVEDAKKRLARLKSH